MDRQDYYRRKAQELLAIAQATRDPTAASWLRGSAIGYERLARNAEQVSRAGDVRADVLSLATFRVDVWCRARCLLFADF